MFSSKYTLRASRILSFLGRFVLPILLSANYSTFDAVFEPAFFLMERRRLQGIRERAEGRLPAEWLSESEILAFVQPPLWADVLGVLAVYAGLQPRL